MPKRIINEYNAFDFNIKELTLIDHILSEAISKILKIIKDSDLDIRDTELLCTIIIHNNFSENILRESLKRIKEVKLKGK